MQTDIPRLCACGCGGQTSGNRRVRYLHGHGKRITITDEHFRIMEDLRDQGLTLFNIAFFFGMSTPVVARAFHDRGHVFMRGKPGNSLGKEWPSTQKATRSPTLADLAWAAGFMEGEASFSKGRIHVNQVNREPLHRLLAIFGGSFTKTRQRGNCKPISEWRASGARARGIAMTLYPFMSERRRGQIRAGLDYVARRAAA